MNADKTKDRLDAVHTLNKVPEMATRGFHWYHGKLDFVEAANVLAEAVAKLRELCDEEDRERFDDLFARSLKHNIRG